jgi:nucleoid DNA-binding protein
MEIYLSKKLKLDGDEAQSLWALILDKIRGTLRKGKPVALTNIGTLEPFMKKPTRYRHPETGEMQDTPRRKHVRFVLSPSLKSALRSKSA